MRILILGNMGYVGPAVVRELRAKHPTHVIDGFDNAAAHHLRPGVLGNVDARNICYGGGTDVVRPAFASQHSVNLQRLRDRGAASVGFEHEAVRRLIRRLGCRDIVRGRKIVFPREH